MRSPIGGSLFRLGLLAALLSLALAPACKKGGEEGEGSGAEGVESAPEEAQEPEEPAAMTPEQLGDAVGQEYVATMTELRDLLAPQPPPEVLRPQVDALFERHVQRFVELGRQRWAMDEAQRMAVDSRIRQWLFTRAPQEIGSIDFLNDALNYYRPLDNDLANRIADFNIITQYASFELLQQQDPEEAQRLGVPPSE